MLELKGGNTEALDGIYTLTSKGAYLLCYSILRDGERAKDAVQNTFIRAAQNIKRYESGTNANAWICRIARNICYREYKNAGRTVSLDAFGDSISDTKGGEEMWVENLMLKAAMNGLTAEEREIVTLFALEGYRHREIAEIVEKPAGTVRWLYNRAIKKLKSIMESESGKKE
jgi:RNA polymerase sigma-70 factor (ECF subfamily)